MKVCRRDCAGFAYLWVLLLVAFLGVGLTVGVELDSTSAQRDRERELISIGRQFRVAIASYYENRGAGGVREYPQSLDDLLRDKRSPGVVRHLRRVFVDPMTGKAEWGLVSVGGRIVGVHSLSDRTPIKQDGFEADEASFRGRQSVKEWVFTYPSTLVSRSDSHDPRATGLSTATDAAQRPQDGSSLEQIPPKQ